MGRSNKTGKLSSLVVLFWYLVAINYFWLSQSSAARILDESSTPDGGHNKAGVRGSRPGPAGSWTGSGTPTSGSITKPPPTSITKIGYANVGPVYASGGSSSKKPKP